MTPFAKAIRVLTAVMAGLTFPVVPSQADTDLPRGVWDGTYTCNQGLTALTLIIEPDGRRWSGLFSFGADKRNKGVPAGLFELVITDVDGDIAFIASDWVTQPADYVAVDLHGRLSDDLTRISGTVDFDGCDAFEVTRRSAVPTPGKTK